MGRLVAWRSTCIDDFPVRLRCQGMCWHAAGLALQAAAGISGWLPGGEVQSASMAMCSHSVQQGPTCRTSLPSLTRGWSCKSVPSGKASTSGSRRSTSTSSSCTASQHDGHLWQDQGETDVLASELGSCFGAVLVIGRSCTKIAMAHLAVHLQPSQGLLDAHLERVDACCPWPRSGTDRTLLQELCCSCASCCSHPVAQCCLHARLQTPPVSPQKQQALCLQEQPASPQNSVYRVCRPAIALVWCPPSLVQLPSLLCLAFCSPEKQRLLEAHQR